ncbi:hypothetical protein AVEN_185-1 [Araneus ventricosus]|uniref:Uncharacterized protein n=1 Tax=Araneus ventricosus TaxID=182803 RepID=A0A4Y2D296_ARAVE|nr:hypothetical protein AVEN_185-1 [Araneus ventricosus]
MLNRPRSSETHCFESDRELVKSLRKFLDVDTSTRQWQKINVDNQDNLPVSGIVLSRPCWTLPHSTCFLFLSLIAVPFAQKRRSRFTGI